MAWPEMYGFTIRDVDPALGDKLGVPSTVEMVNVTTPEKTAGTAAAAAVVTQSFGIHPIIVWALVLIGGLVLLGVLPGNPFK